MSELKKLKSNFSDSSNMLPLKIKGEDGHVYTLNLFEANLATMKDLWEKSKRYKILFSDQSLGKFTMFSNWILHPRTIVLTVDDVGIVYLTDLIPRVKADGHYFFWDRKTASRHAVILGALRWAFDSFELNKINIRTPRTAYSALHRIYKIGFRLEGVEREGIQIEGKWQDILHFGVLNDEITNNTISRGCLEQDVDEKNWYGMLKYDRNLMKYITRERG